MGTLYESYSTGIADELAAANSTVWIGQNFRPVTPHTITSAEIFIGSADATPTDVLVKLFEVDAATSKPTGSVLDEGEITAADVPGSAGTYLGYDWCGFAFGTGVALVTAKMYSLVAMGSTNSMGWGTDDTSPTYARGSAISGASSGASWTLYETIDCHFKEYGNPVAGGISRGASLFIGGGAKWGF